MNIFKQDYRKNIKKEKEALTETIFEYLSQKLHIEKFYISPENLKFSHSKILYVPSTNEIFVLQLEKKLFLWIFSLDLCEDVTQFNIDHKKYSVLMMSSNKKEINTNDLNYLNSFGIVETSDYSKEKIVLANDHEAFGNYFFKQQNILNVISYKKSFKVKEKRKRWGIFDFF